MYVEISLVLPGEAGGGQVLSGGRRADGNTQSGTVLLDHALVCGDDLLADWLGQGRFVDQLTRVSVASCEVIGVVLVHPTDDLLQPRPGPRTGERVPVGLGGHCEPIGHVHAEWGQSAVQLAKRSVLTSDLGDVVDSQLLKPTNVGAIRGCAHLELLGCDGFSGPRMARASTGPTANEPEGEQPGGGH